MPRNGRRPKSPAFQFYPGDFLADPKVGAMSTEAQGAYIRLLCYAWLDGSIPSDPEVLAPMCGLSLESFTRAWSSVQRCWVESFPGQLVNPRLERERQFQSDGRARRLAASKVAIEARQRATGNGQANESSTNRSTDDPLTLHPTPETRDPKPVLVRKPRAARTGPHAELIQFFERRWHETRGVAYAIQTKDCVAAATALKLAKGDLALAQARVEAMLTSPDAWVAQHASLPLLISQWNAFAVKVVPRPKGALQNLLDGLCGQGPQNGLVTT